MFADACECVFDSNPSSRVVEARFQPAFLAGGEQPIRLVFGLAEGEIRAGAVKYPRPLNFKKCGEERSEHRDRARALDDDPGDTGNHADQKRRLHELASAELGFVAIDAEGGQALALGHETDKLGVSEPCGLNKCVIDATHADRGTMKQTFQGIQHGGGGG